MKKVTMSTKLPEMKYGLILLQIYIDSQLIHEVSAYRIPGAYSNDFKQSIGVPLDTPSSVVYTCNIVKEHCNLFAFTLVDLFNSHNKNQKVEEYYFNFKSKKF
jgi:hypothetical protein